MWLNARFVKRTPESCWECLAVWRSDERGPGWLGPSGADCYSCIPSRRARVKLTHAAFDWHATTASGTWDGACRQPAEDDMVAPPTLPLPTGAHLLSGAESEPSLRLPWCRYLTTQQQRTFLAVTTHFNQKFSWCLFQFRFRCYVKSRRQNNSDRYISTHWTVF